MPEASGPELGKHAPGRRRKHRSLRSLPTFRGVCGGSRRDAPAWCGYRELECLLRSTFLLILQLLRRRAEGLLRRITPRVESPDRSGRAERSAGMSDEDRTKGAKGWKRRPSKAEKCGSSRCHTLLMVLLTVVRVVSDLLR